MKLLAAFSIAIEEVLLIVATDWVLRRLQARKAKLDKQMGEVRPVPQPPDRKSWN